MFIILCLSKTTVTYKKTNIGKHIVPGYLYSLAFFIYLGNAEI